jgi:acetyl-CoA synthetase
MAEPDSFPFAQPVVWQPTQAVVDASNLRRFLDAHGLDSLDELQRRSAADPGWFWDAVLTDLGIEFYRPYDRILDLERGPEWPVWCVGGEMNVVHNCLEKWLATPTADACAVRFEAEDGHTSTLSYRELNEGVCRVAAGLASRGIGKGDAVGVFMPMTPEIVIALLAIAKIGAVILPLFSGFGAAAIASRLADADAVALFVSDGAPRRGREVPMKAVADEALEAVPTVTTVVVHRRMGTEIPFTPGRDVFWEDLVSTTEDDVPTARTSAEDTVMIIYTSGTTGRPKGAVHSHCGFPIKSAQDMAHGFDVRPGDTVFWMTDMGWMMGPWEVFGVLLLGATMLLFDGAPDYPDAGRVWSLVERHGVTVLGLAPTFVRSVMAHGDGPLAGHDLSSLRLFGSTGEAWNVAPWMWLFDNVGGRTRPIINYSGGTEISGGIVMGNVLSSLKPCAFSGPAPGMAAEVVDDSGRPVRGQVGELVVRAPWIGMTRGFWRDPERYLDAYWRRIPGMWVHGDFAAIDEDGLWYILGRSDDTIKVAGKRVGPAEIESILVGHPAVIEAAAVGVPDEMKGDAIVAFAVLADGVEPSDALRAELKALVARDLGKPLAPKEVRFVKDIPKTRNAKVMRRVARSAYLGLDPGDLSALVNPEAVTDVKESR